MALPLTLQDGKWVFGTPWFVAHLIFINQRMAVYIGVVLNQVDEEPHRDKLPSFSMMHEGLRERLDDEGDELMFLISSAREERNA